MSRKKEKVDAHSPFAKLAELKKKLASEAATSPAPTRPSPPKAPPPASDQDEALSFHRLMSGVVPLETTRQGKPGATAPSAMRTRLAEARAAEVRQTAEVREHLRELADARFEVSDDGARVEGRRVDVPPADVRKLRRGLYPIDARVDLHGMTEREARAAVVEFLRDTRARGERCVLVIHGRGTHSPGGSGILRGEVAAWLSQGPASVHVAAFATAADADGGAGAVYVMLRR